MDRTWVPEPSRRPQTVHPMKSTHRVPESFTGEMKKMISGVLTVSRNDAKTEGQRRVEELVRFFEGSKQSRKVWEVPVGINPDLMPGRNALSPRHRQIKGSMISSAIQHIETALPPGLPGNVGESASSSADASAASSRSQSIAASPRTSFVGDSRPFYPSPAKASCMSHAVPDGEVASRDSDRTNCQSAVPVMPADDFQEDQGFVIKQLVQQLQAVQADKARLAEENESLKRENSSLREMLSIRMDFPEDNDMEGSDDGFALEGMCD